MTIYLNNETDIDLGIDYNDIANKVVCASLDYVNCPYECEVNILLGDNDSIQCLNKAMRNIDSATDVLLFPAYDFEIPGDFSGLNDGKAFYFNSDTGEFILGDIMISLEKVSEQAEEFGHSVTREYAFLIAHSILHLCGFDHIDEDDRITMEKMQDDILTDIGYTRDAL